MIKTKFSFEVPLAHLEDFSEDQDFLFSLSFLFSEERYTKYLEGSSLPLWIDNSYNELKEASLVGPLMELYSKWDPQYLISPDHAEWNHQKHLDTYLEFRQGFIPHSRLMVIIHHPDWIGHFQSYGVENFCVPYDFRYCTEHKLKRFSKCHFLGLVSVAELLIARPPSCDTSIPIKLALQNRTMPEWVFSGCQHIHTYPDFFQQKMSPRQIDLAKRNIKYLREVLA